MSIKVTHSGAGLPTASHGISKLAFSRTTMNLGVPTVIVGGTLTEQHENIRISEHNRQPHVP